MFAIIGFQSHAPGVFAKQRQRIFAGAWGVPNKQSKNAVRRASGGLKYPKGYFNRLLATIIGREYNIPIKKYNWKIDELL